MLRDVKSMLCAQLSISISISVGSTSVRIIPPLRGLERVFCCSWCQFNLFNLASVIRTDIDLRPLRAMLSTTAEDKHGSSSNSTSQRNLFRGSSSKDDQAFKEYFPEDESSSPSSFTMPAPALTSSRSAYSASGTSNKKSFFGGFITVFLPCLTFFLILFLLFSNKIRVISGGRHIAPPLQQQQQQQIAPAKPFYREPPKTMRNSGSKSFDFAGADFSPTNISTASSGEGEMDICHEEDDQEEGSGSNHASHQHATGESNEQGQNQHRHVEIPVLCIDAGRVGLGQQGLGNHTGHNSSGSGSSREENIMPTRHGSGRLGQVCYLRLYD